MSKSVIYFYQVVEFETYEKFHTKIKSDLIHMTYKNAIDELFYKGFRYKKVDKLDHVEYFYKEKESERNYDEECAMIIRLELPKNEIKEI